MTGATVTSKAVQNAVADCIQQASGGAINPAQQSTEETSSTADWLGEAPEIAESDIKQTVDCEVLVVGAGSSGSFAAAAAAEAGAKTILIEKFGHDMASGIRDTLAACGSKQQQEDGDDVSKKDAVRYLCNWSQGYTRRSLAQVWADKSGETMDWFTDVLAESGIDFRHEIDEKHEGDNYEVLDVGHSTQYGEEYSEQLTMDAVLKHAEADGLEVQYEITMVKLEKDGDRVTGLIAKNANDEYVRYNASKGVILACGGKASPQHGSDGSGYGLLRALHIPVTEVFPSLVQITTEPKRVKALKGMRVHAEISLSAGRETLASQRGEIQFTEFGLSGIAAMQLSRFVSLEKGRRMEAVLDLLPAFSHGQAADYLAGRIRHNPELAAEHLLTGLLPKRVGQVLLKQAGIDLLSRPIGSLQKAEIGAVAGLLKGWRFPATGTRGFSAAQVTIGGASALPSSLKRWRRCPSRAFTRRARCWMWMQAAAALNLQWAWSSGRLAGRSAAQKLIKGQAAG